jgi:hypothetical protein
MRHLNQPEALIQVQLIKRLKELDWFVKVTHGNMYQSGFPDLYCAHKSFGTRWIEVKLPDMKGSRFTAAQLDTFHRMGAVGVGIWILTCSTDSEIKKLFGPPNWYMYLSIMHKDG